MAMTWKVLNEGLNPEQARARYNEVVAEVNNNLDMVLTPYEDRINSYVNKDCTVCRGTGVIENVMPDTWEYWKGVCVGTHPSNYFQYGDMVLLSPGYQRGVEHVHNIHKFLRIPSSVDTVLFFHGDNIPFVYERGSTLCFAHEEFLPDSIGNWFDYDGVMPEDVVC